MTRYLIIGNGVAGMSAAQEIRQADPEGQITIVGDEPDPTYYRASLSEWIAEDNTEDMVMARTKAFYGDMRLETLQDYVSAVDLDAKSVTMSDGSLRAYDRLLIATGAQPNVIPIEGLDSALTYRTWDDARTIKRAVDANTRVLILGGGVLGLELAGALVRTGVHDIAIVQLLDFVGPPLLDRPAGEWLQERIRADGLHLFLGDTVTRVESNTAVFRSGETWDFDVFVQSVGVGARYPDVPGLATGRGVRIDAHTATNLPDIYAAGDCTETCKPDGDRWQPTRTWLDCARQGRVAGCSMAGIDASLADTPFFNASILYDVNYAYIGEPNADQGESFLWTTERAYRKIRTEGERLAGALLMGDRTGAMAIHKAVGRAIGSPDETFARPDYPWNDLTGRDWDYLFY
jgi:nitrite reductase (NADH) large subunit